MVLVFIFPLFLIFLFSCSFPFEIKHNRKNNEHVKEPVFVFRLGTRKRTEAIGREEGLLKHGEGLRVYGQGANPAHFPHPLKQEKKETGPPTPPFLRVCRLEGNKRRGGREKERGETNKDCIFNGKSKETNRRDMSREEGETKQGAEKMALFFVYPLPLISPCPLSFRSKKTKKEEL